LTLSAPAVPDLSFSSAIPCDLCVINSKAFANENRKGSRRAAKDAEKKINGCKKIHKVEAVKRPALFQNFAPLRLCVNSEMKIVRSQISFSRPLVKFRG